MNKSPILIIGKNGKTGRRVDSGLQALGYTTRAVSRSTTPAFDWEDPTTWRAAMTGTVSAYVTFHPDLAIPSAEQNVREFVTLAADVGIEHIVLLSGRGEEGAQRAETILQSSGLDWNVVRASWFMQNFSESFMIEGILSGELLLPAGDIVEPFVDVDDVADVAVTALTRPELRDRLFEVTGPRALSFTDCVSEIAMATDYAVKFSSITVAAFIDTLRSQGVPEEVQWLMRELFTVVFDGRNSQPMSGVEDALGRPATDFSEYVRKVKASGAWKRSGMLKLA